MHFHLVCSPEFLVVAFSRKSTRKTFRSIVRTHASQGPWVRTEPYISPLCPSSMPLSRGHIILLREAGNGGVLGSVWVSQTQVVCVRKR